MLRQDRDDELGPTVVCTYTCIIELPKDMYNMEYSLVFNSWVLLYDENDIKAFADDVNSGNSYEGTMVVLAADIDMSATYGEGKETWTPIGTEDHPFNGTFNGCGHIINLSVYMDYDTEVERGGLFGYTGSKSKITNLTVSGNVLVLGWLMMKPTLGDGTNIGAVAGYNKGIIENCANKANVEYTGNVGHSAGIAGKTEGAIINCYNIGTVKISGKQGSYIAYAEDNALIQNCYYLSETESIYGKTAEQFASGEVSYFLGSAWGQEIGKDEYPVLGGKSVYRIEGENDYEYTNTPPQETYPYKITGLRFTDTAGEEIIKPSENQSFIVETDIVKTEERNEKDYLFVAVYDESGALMSLNYVKAKFTVDGECSFGFNISAQKKAVGSVRVFVWNALNSMEPLAETKILAPVVFE